MKIYNLILNWLKGQSRKQWLSYIILLLKWLNGQSRNQWLRYIILLLFLCSFIGLGGEKPNSIYKYEFAVCAIFQNEAPYLKEWIEYHKLIGAEHFYLYNNESADNYLQILAPYLADGTVEIVDWTEPDFQFSGQKKAYWHAIQKSSGEVKWLAIIDIDEYLVPKLHDSMPLFLSDYDKEDIGGVCINWQMFGTSYVPKIEKDELLTEKLILKALENHSENLLMKSVVRPERVIEPPHVHYFEYQSGCRHIDTHGDTVDNSSRTAYVRVDKAQINHYWTKDEAFFYNKKVPRRLQWGDSMETINQRVTLLNQMSDYSIQRFIPQLKERMSVMSELKSLEVFQ